MNTLFISILLAVMPVVMPFLVAAAGALFKRLDSMLPANESQLIESLASSAVSAAEQSLSGAAGEAKYAAASAWLSASLARYGITLSADEIKSVIENAVYYLKQDQATAAAPAAKPAA